MQPVSQGVIHTKMLSGDDVCPPIVEPEPTFKSFIIYKIMCLFGPYVYILFI